jgi:phosphoribosylanthranilate isomerase
MWIKICGITSLKDAEMAIAAGADAIGFVFAESPRRVTPEAARAIIEKLPPSVEKIGIFVDAFPGEVAAVQQLTGLSGVQLHGLSSAAMAKELRALAGKRSSQMRTLQVVRYGGDSDRFALELRNFNGNSAMDAVLVDTCVVGKEGGTGQTFDWLTVRASFLREASHLRLIAAGGLRPENVRAAIHTLRPWGVDVSSGVEAAPGRKDPIRVADFIRAARDADAELGAAARA